MDKFSNLLPPQVDLTEESLLRMVEEISKIPGPFIVRPRYLVPTFPIPPPNPMRYRLIPLIDAVEMGVPRRSIIHCGDIDTKFYHFEFYWIDKRCLKRYQRRSSK